MKKQIIYLLIVSAALMGNISDAFAQYKVATGVPVFEQGNPLKNPWVGGLNAPILSAVDMNGDGIKDLFIFDREGNRISTYINNGTPGQVDYVFAPGYEKFFPKDMSDFALLVDYDCDGKEDIFTYSYLIGGMKVYRNDYTTAGGLKFTETYPIVNSLYGTVLANLYVARVNLPALADIDYDGDLDVLTFPVLGNYVEYHKNMAKEYFNRCDTLVYEVQWSCWGNFGLSGFSNTAILNAGCRLAAPTPPVPDPTPVPAPGDDFAQHGLHSGSCMIAIDIEGDGDRDLLNGDILGNNMLLVINGGTASQALMTAQDSLFPVYDVSVDLVTFPAPYYLDVNNDGNKDFITTPCISGPSENFDNVWYYRNTTNNITNVFDYTHNRLLSDEMIEVGAGAMATLYDIDTDGLTDMVIGNYGYYSDVLPFTSGLSYYRNTGSATAPVFTLQTRDLGGFFTLGILGIAPAFGDLNNDGDADLIMGNLDGTLVYFSNTSGPGNTPAYTMVQAAMTDNNGAVIDVGQNSTPQIVDVNRDGRWDLLIGERNGNLNYFENTGSVTVPVFTSASSSFGGLNVTNYLNLYGYSYPCLYDSAGVYQLLVGAVNGFIYQYNNIDNNLSGTFNLVDSMYYGIYESARSTLGVSDLNSDGVNEILVGNNAGGVTMYGYDSTTAIPNQPLMLQGIQIYPNPAVDQLIIKFGSTVAQNRFVTIFDITGRVIDEQVIFAGSAFFDVSRWSQGVYQVRVIEGAKVMTARFVVGR